MAEYDLGTARGKIELDADGAVTGAKKLNSAIDGIEGSASRSSASVTAAGLGLVSFGTAALGAFALAIKASADFEKTLSSFKAVTGATADQMDLIREKALQLGADTSFSAGEAADAMVELGKQGLTTSQILDGAADATVALAAAGEIDLAQAAAISARALNQFKLSATELPAIADLLAGAANASATGVSEIGAALEYVGPVAEAVGLNIKDTTTAIALFANAGIDGQKAGTALRAILSRLNPASKPAAAAMEKLGILTADGANKFFTAEGKVKSFAEIIDVLNTSTADLTDQQKLQALETIFGTEALAAINVMAGSTAGSFNELQANILKVKAADVAAEKMNNLAGAIEEFKGSVETAMIKAGAPFQDGLKGIVQAATGVINSFAKLSPEIQRWIGYAVAAVGALSLLGGGFILGSKYIKTFKDTFSLLNDVIGKNPIVRAIGIIVLLGIAIYTAYKKVQWFHDAIDTLWDKAGPVWDTIREAAEKLANWFTSTFAPVVTRVWDDIKKAVEKTVNYFKDEVIPRLQEVWTKVEPYWNDLKNFIVGLGSAIGTFASNAKGAIEEFAKGFSENGSVATLQDKFQGLISWIESTFIPAMKTIWSKVQPAVTTFADFVKTEGGGAFDTLKAKAQEAIDAISEKLGDGGISGALSGIGDTLGGGISGAISGIQTFVSFLTDTAVPAIQSFASGAITQFGLFVDWIKLNVGPVITAIGELFTAIGTRAKEAFDSALPVIQTALAAIGVVIAVAVAAGLWLWENFGERVIQSALIVWDFIKGWIEGALQVVRGIINVITGLISGDWGKVWEGIKNILQGIWNVMWAIVSTALELIWQTIRGVGGIIASIWSGLWDGVGRVLSAAWNGIRSGVSNGINDIISFFGGLRDRVFGALGSIDLFGAGRRIMESLFNGLKAIWGDIQNFVSGIGKWISDHKGPASYDAKLLVDNGKLIMSGLFKGLETGFKDVRSLVGGVGPFISSSLTPPPAASPAAHSVNSSISFVVNMNNVSNPDQVVSAFDNVLLDKISSAARAGVGKRF
jgi:TP901 family phage tail tape measure protein